MTEQQAINPIKHIPEILAVDLLLNYFEYTRKERTKKIDLINKFCQLQKEMNK